VTTRRIRAAALAGLLALPARAASSAADDQPFPLTVQIPYGFLFLHVPAFGASIPPAGAWTFDVGVSSGNNFIFSDNVADSLARRTSRVPMTQAEFDAIVAAHPGEDAYYVDDEGSRLYARFGATVAPSVFVGAVVSAIRISGSPWMDDVIETFHSDFGFDPMYRDVVPQGETTTAFHVGGNDVYLSPSARSGFEDPVVYVQWTPERRFGAWRMSVLSGVKIPLASTSRLLSSGSADVGAAYAATGEFGRWSVNLNAGVVVPGRVEFLGGVNTSPMLAAASTFGLRLDPVSLWLEFQWEESPFRGASASTLAENVTDLALGLRFPMGGRVRGFFAFTENLTGLENSTDIAFHFGVTWTTRPR
jgi:hypothetical protein